MARHFWSLSVTDMCEIAANSVRQSGFPEELKKVWHGERCGEYVEEKRRREEERRRGEEMRREEKRNVDLLLPYVCMCACVLCVRVRVCVLYVCMLYVWQTHPKYRF